LPCQRHNAQRPRKTLRETGGRPRPVQPSAAYQHRAESPRRAAAEQPLEIEQGAATAPHSRFHVLALPNHGRCGAPDTRSEHRLLAERRRHERAGGRSRHAPARSPTARKPAHRTHLCDGPASAHRFNASPLSSSLKPSASGTTPTSCDAQANGPPLPCSGHRPVVEVHFGLSTCGTLPVSGVSITGVTHSEECTRHRLITPAARDLPLLVMLVTETVTSLDPLSSVRGAIPERRLHACSRTRDFSRQNPEAPAYPSTDGLFTRFGTVSVSIHRQALAGLSWLSSSPPAVSAGRRAWSPARSPASLRTSSPRRHGLNEVRDPEPPATDYAASWPDGPNAASPFQA
jgi:hypothetical protein